MKQLTINRIQNKRATFFCACFVNGQMSPARHCQSLKWSSRAMAGGMVKCPRTRGVATLPTVILISIMALVIAIGVTSLSFTELMISQGGSQSSRALFYAEAGARDALMRIARNKNFATSSYAIDFTTGGTGCSPTYGGCATVSVSSTTPKIATSTGAMGPSTRILSVSVTLDANGTITGTTWSEATN